MEQLLHYVWKHRLFNQNLTTADGKKIEIVDVGILNSNEGPDFFNAKVKIDKEMWIGNVEIHHKSSDWYKHKHETNKVYNSVILHIVEDVNQEVYNEARRAIPQCKLSYPIQLKENIDFLLHAGVAMPCANYIGSIEKIHIDGWMNTLLLERLERKANDIDGLLQRFCNSWEDVLYITLARSLGSGLNSDAFQQLALSVPLRFIQKQGDSIHQIEALLLGQAGMLDNEVQPDEYSRLLQQEYLFLKNKYSLTPLDSSIFRNLRVRPTSTPHLRIAQFASLLFTKKALFSTIIKCEDIGQIRLAFHENASEYWQTHYLLGEESQRKTKYLGDSSLDTILINTVIPVIFAYGKTVDNEILCERALRFLEVIKPENNFITRDFASIKLKSYNAYDSQALIQLKREYCEKRKCLYCRIGYKILSEKNKKNEVH